MTDPAAPPPDALLLRAERARFLELLRAAVDLRVDDATRDLLRRLLALPDRAMRGLALVRRLSALDARGCLSLLQALLDGALRRDAAAQEVLLDLTTTRPLLRRFGYERARALYELARGREQLALARLLLSPTTLHRRRAAPDTLENRHLPDTSLGWRKTLAKGSDRGMLDRLLFDPHPHVVEALLRNPRVVERDVVRVAAMRPANPDCLDAVFAHPRWVRRQRVKVALVLNPDTPLDIALTLLPQLLEQELRHAAVADKLDPILTEEAGALLARRRSLRAAWTPTSRLEPEDPLDVDALAEALRGWMAPPPRR